MPLHQAAIEGTIVGNDLSSVWIYAWLSRVSGGRGEGMPLKRIKTLINSHADNPSEISDTHIDE